LHQYGSEPDEYARFKAWRDAVESTVVVDEGGTT
jgi:hypothetical protein